MGGQHLGILAVELDFLVVTDINLSKIVFVEITTLQHVAFIQYLLFLQLILRAKNKPGGIQLFILSGNGLCLCLVLSSQIGHILVKGSDLLALSHQLGILLCKACFQLLNALRLPFHLSLQVLDGLLQLVGIERAGTQLLFQLVYQLAILFHCR